MQHIRPQLRLLAPKGKASPHHLVSPVQHRLLLEHNNNQDKQDIEAIEATTAATSQSCFPSFDPESASSSHNFTLPSLLLPDSTTSSPERKQYAVASPRMGIHSSRVPLTLANNGSLGFYPETFSRKW